MTLEQAEAEFKAAAQAYADAKRGLSSQRFAAQHGMRNTLAHNEMTEYTAYQRWLRAHERVVALRPAPEPKQSTPKIATAVAVPKPSPPSTAKAELPSYAEADREVQRAQEVYRAAMRRRDEAHKRAVAEADARHTATLSQR